MIRKLGSIVYRFYDRYWPALLLDSPVVVLVGGPMLLMFGNAYYGEFKEYLNRIPFESARWQDESQWASDDPIRIRMVDDLLDTHDFSGRSRDEVVALLGEPRPTGYFHEYELVYWLGPERGFLSIDSEWLVFDLDANGRVAAYQIMRD